MLSRPEPIKAICKNCGSEAIATDFKMSGNLKLMVCPNCLARSKLVCAQKPTEEKMKNATDEYVEAFERQQQRLQEKKEKLQQKIPDEKIRVACQKCAYIFKYNLDKRTPHSCPYCNAKVPKIRH